LVEKAENGKPALYQATERFLRTWRHHMRAVLQAMLVLDPEIKLLLDRFDDGSTFETFARLLCEGFAGFRKQPEIDTAWYRVFMHRMEVSRSFMRL
jgi:hypothetical protein